MEGSVVGERIRASGVAEIVLQGVPIAGQVCSWNENRYSDRRAACIRTSMRHAGAPHHGAESGGNKERLDARQIRGRCA